jgi:putative ABC transport system substrate-binding protein
VTSLAGELQPKRLELLHELMPAAANIGLLFNPNNDLNNPVIGIPANLQEPARALGLQLHVVHASRESDFDAAFASLDRLRVSGLLIVPNLLLNTRSEQLAKLTARYNLPAIFQFREFAAAGGLMSYGGSITANYRLLGAYTGRILKGERPADLPVQQATRVELIINMKAAKALGLTFPISLLGRADEVIE